MFKLNIDKKAIDTLIEVLKKKYADLKIKDNYSFKAISAKIEKLINEVYQNHKEF